MGTLLPVTSRREDHFTRVAVTSLAVCAASRERTRMTRLLIFGVSTMLCLSVPARAQEEPSVAKGNRTRGLVGGWGHSWRPIFGQTTSEITALDVTRCPGNRSDLQLPTVHGRWLAPEQVRRPLSGLRVPQPSHLERRDHRRESRDQCRDVSHRRRVGPATLNDLRPATCDLRPATCDLRLATCDLRPATCDLRLALRLVTWNSRLMGCVTS